MKWSCHGRPPLLYLLILLSAPPSPSCYSGGFGLPMFFHRLYLRGRSLFFFLTSHQAPRVAWVCPPTALGSLVQWDSHRFVCLEASSPSYRLTPIVYYVQSVLLSPIFFFLFRKRVHSERNGRNKWLYHLSERSFHLVQSGYHQCTTSVSLRVVHFVILWCLNGMATDIR